MTTHIVHAEPTIRVAMPRLYSRGEFEALIGMTLDRRRWQGYAYDQGWTDLQTEEEWWWRYLAFVNDDDASDERDTQADALH